MRKPSAPGRFWPARVQLQDDLSPAAWIRPRLRPWGRGRGTPVGAVVPAGYPAYVRILHPLGPGPEHLRWKDLAQAAGVTYHPLLQWERIPLPLSGSIGIPCGAPPTGATPSSLRQALLPHLEKETSTPESAYFGVWEGKGLLHRGSSGCLDRGDPSPGRQSPLAELESLHRMVAGRARFALPERNYLLGHGKLEELVNFSDALTPSLIWPADRAFCCATEIDFDSTLVGLSAPGAARLLQDDSLEALPIAVTDRLDIGGDAVNPPLPRPPRRRPHE